MLFICKSNLIMNAKTRITKIFLILLMYNVKTELTKAHFNLFHIKNKMDSSVMPCLVLTTI